MTSFLTIFTSSSDGNNISVFLSFGNVNFGSGFGSESKKSFASLSKDVFVVLFGNVDIDNSLSLQFWQQGFFGESDFFSLLFFFQKN